MNYKQAGVDVEEERKASEILYNAAKKTWENRAGRIGEVITSQDNFSGIKQIQFNNMIGYLNSDGVGTKIEVGERMKKHNTIAHCLLAMCTDDAVSFGGEPVGLTTVLDVNTLSKEGISFIPYITQIAKGYITAAKAGEVAIFNGELAELGDRVQGYGDFNYNWSATCLWTNKQERLITGKHIQEGDAIVALYEPGFRSNGFSLLRRILGKESDEWHQLPFNGETMGSIALSPSTIYAPAVLDIIGRYDEEPKGIIHGIAHITGGGIPEKLGRVLQPQNKGAVLENLFLPNELMAYCQRKGEISDREAYQTWNMGQGMLIITPDPNKVISIIEKRGHTARQAGIITKKTEIVIKSRGQTKEDLRWTYN